MNKNQLIGRLVAEHGGLSHSRGKILVDDLLALINEGLARDQEVKISGFGTFHEMAIRPRPIQLPSGDCITTVYATRTTFKAGTIFRNALNASIQDES
jgi:nucleoid DNA-binding protein